MYVFMYMYVCMSEFRPAGTGTGTVVWVLIGGNTSAFSSATPIVVRMTYYKNISTHTYIHTLFAVQLPPTVVRMTVTRCDWVNKSNNRSVRCKCVGRVDKSDPREPRR